MHGVDQRGRRIEIPHEGPAKPWTQVPVPTAPALAWPTRSSP